MRRSTPAPNIEPTLDALAAVVFEVPSSNGA